MKGVQVQGGLYEMVVGIKTKKANCLASRATSNNYQLWHERLQHASSDMLQKSKNITLGLEKLIVDKKNICTECLKSKSICQPHRQQNFESKHSTKIGDLVHTDLMSTQNISSLGGSKHYITLYDDSTAISMVRFLQRKGDAFNALTEMINETTTLAEKQVKRIRMDNGSEYTSRKLETWLKSKGIMFEFTAAYNPQSNGKAERLNRTLNDSARSMLMPLQSNPEYINFWA